MLDALSLDQLRTFIAAAEEGSFSAAGRKLGRAQSVVSQTLANLEGQLGVRLFDRSTRLPRLTEQGRALLADARVVAAGVDDLKARARGLAEGLEPELSVVMDVMFPMPILTEMVGSFREVFPNTPLRMHVEALGAAVGPLLDGRCRIGVIGTLPDIPDIMVTEPLVEMPLVMVAAPGHPLAAHRGIISRRLAKDHVQLVLTDRSRLTEGRDFGVVSSQSWRLADLGAKHAFLRAGFGWGSMPRAMVEPDLAAGDLVEIQVEGAASKIGMMAVYRRDAPPGPAGRWLIDRLRRG
ncbi:LysR family transcriptional regulator [Arenibaculum pallidiluteum]|uniref:LysR family transcriptional regulator n=1 Tax=Arenibaculum pallidiluteum TaxID=2812559 RepID=UPI001A961C71|nr:LysR family transcriptional regulator [Arenibaculum pallidiluteum]